MQASSGGLLGEDAAYFDPAQQSAPKWAFFTAELAAVLGIMYVVRAHAAQPCLPACGLWHTASFPSPLCPTSGHAIYNV